MQQRNQMDGVDGLVFMIIGQCPSVVKKGMLGTGSTSPRSMERMAEVNRCFTVIRLRFSKDSRSEL
ncbi:MAG: hypothetical protein A4C66_11535 [Nitrospira sp. HN-bin3]|nr:MAG: hypothetical protein A4C66_11535 [Nitrospira sp. HN-bin3]